MKVIQIVHHSISKFGLGVDLKSFEDDWHIRVAKQILKRTNKYGIECWQPERTFKQVYSRKNDGITYRLFPSFYIPVKGINKLEISLPLLRELRKEAKKEKILIHLHNYRNPAFYLIASLFKDVPIIAQDHGPFRPRFALFPWRHIAEKITFRNIDYFFTLTEGEKKYISDLVGEEKVEMGTMGVDYERFKPMDKIAARRKLNLPTDRKIVLTVCYLSEIKGIECMLRALPPIIAAHPDLLYVVVGASHGDYDKQLKKLAAELNLAEFVRFIDSPSKTILLLTYQAADLFVLPSLSEGAPVVIMEALACDIPVIATDVGYVSRMVDIFKTGLLVPPGDVQQLSKAIMTFFVHQDKFEDCRKVSRQRFDWDTIITNTIRVYDDLFDRYYGRSK